MPIREVLENSITMKLCRQCSTRDVARRRPDALEVPDGLASFGEVVREEAATVLTVEDSSEAPLVTRECAEVQNLHHEQVAGHRSFAFRVRHPDRPTQVVHLPIDQECNRESAQHP